MKDRSRVLWVLAAVLIGGWLVLASDGRPAGTQQAPASQGSSDAKSSGEKKKELYGNMPMVAHRWL